MFLCVFCIPLNRLELLLFRRGRRGEEALVLDVAVAQRPGGKSLQELAHWKGTRGLQRGDGSPTSASSSITVLTLGRRGRSGGGQGPPGGAMDVSGLHPRALVLAVAQAAQGVGQGGLQQLDLVLLQLQLLLQKEYNSRYQVGQHGRDEKKERQRDEESETTLCPPH
ncbi:hypothetical protein EYF80_023855 [Liparis tanakae]|uniref:Uncharacterized protein n=1 Tax=Liparis tanakae TaxID=230148 RepID=A0A4Z2HKM5_9TELE|nr:hypothetical protein EYF80_023855 [Liparis tanakae]